MRDAGKNAAADVLAVAIGEIGYHEDAGHKNKYGAWYGLDGEPWCMEFVQWVYAQAGIPLPYKTASCGELLRWYRAHQPECVTRDPVPGCVVIFDFPGGAPTDHTGIFVEKTDMRLTTIDGNTSGGSDANGGWVQRRTRSLSYANPTYIVPRELQEGASPAEPRFDSLAEISDGAPWAVDTIEKLIDKAYIRGSGIRDAQGRPADLDLNRDMLRLLVILDRAHAFD